MTRNRLTNGLGVHVAWLGLRWSICRSPNKKLKPNNSVDTKTERALNFDGLYKSRSSNPNGSLRCCKFGIYNLKQR